MPRDRKKYHAYSQLTLSQSKPTAGKADDDEILDAIYSVLENANTALKSPTIHRKIMVGCNIWNVRENLQKLKEANIAVKSGEDGWILTENCDDITTRGNQLGRRSWFSEDIIIRNLSTEILKIIACLRGCTEKHVELISSTCGQNKARISRLLHYLESKNIVAKRPGNHWLLISDLTDDEVDELARENPNMADEDRTREGILLLTGNSHIQYILILPLWGGHVTEL